MKLLIKAKILVQARDQFYFVALVMCQQRVHLPLPQKGIICTDMQKPHTIKAIWIKCCGITTFVPRYTKLPYFKRVSLITIHDIYQYVKERSRHLNYFKLNYI